MSSTSIVMLIIAGASIIFGAVCGVVNIIDNIYHRKRIS